MLKSWFIFITVLFLFNFFWLSASVKDNLGHFPEFLSTDSRSGYFSVKAHSRQNSKRVERLQVYDDFECVRQCRRLGIWCESINYQTTPDSNGLHICEINLVDKNQETTSRAAQSASFERLALEPPIHESCVDVYLNGGKTSGVYKILPPINFPSMYIYCDMKTDRGGWTVIQRRLDGSVDFYRDWDNFKKGFGDKLGEYWLGLDVIHSMTSRLNYTLRIDLEDFAGKRRYAVYEKFLVADESDNYRLTVDKYSGTAGDSLKSHSGSQFSTRDRDNDIDSTNSCAVKFKGAWWHKNCHFSNLNGEYGKDRSQGAGIVWSKFKENSWDPLKKTEMKIRPIDY